jgi:hypothetical protein
MERIKFCPGRTVGEAVAQGRLRVADIVKERYEEPVVFRS